MFYTLLTIYSYVLLQLNSNWAKWRETPWEHCFNLDEIYHDISVTGKQVWAPSSGVMHNLIEDLTKQTDSNGDDLDGGPFEHHMPEYNDNDANEGTQSLHNVRKLVASSGKESKSSRLTGTQKVLQNMDKMFSAFDSRSTTSSEQLNIGKVDIKKAIEAMTTLPEIEIGGDLYMFRV